MLQNVNIKLTVLKDIYYREQKDVLVVANKENKRDFIIFFLSVTFFKHSSSSNNLQVWLHNQLF